ncbi:MAG: hypothetical protein P8I93_05430 [Crocinitomicaceae bacterium]|nr:hypothetical protein [Crocinitomicaceae bacterium]
MHFFTKTSLLLLTITLLFACESKSSKSNSDSSSKKETKEWSKADKRKCIRELNSTFQENDKETALGMQMFLYGTDLTEREFSECVCEKLQEDYDSYEEADKEADKISDEEGLEYIVNTNCTSEEIKVFAKELLLVQKGKDNLNPCDCAKIIEDCSRGMVNGTMSKMEIGIKAGACAAKSEMNRSFEKEVENCMSNGSNNDYNLNNKNNLNDDYIGNESTNYGWSSYDKQRFRKEMKKVGVEDLDFIECYLSKCESNFSSYEEADLAEESFLEKLANDCVN